MNNNPNFNLSQKRNNSDENKHATSYMIGNMQRESFALSPVPRQSAMSPTFKNRRISEKQSTKLAVLKKNFGTPAGGIIRKNRGRQQSRYYVNNVKGNVNMFFSQSPHNDHKNSLLSDFSNDKNEHSNSRNEGSMPKRKRTFKSIPLSDMLHVKNRLIYALKVFDSRGSNLGSIFHPKIRFSKVEVQDVLRDKFLIEKYDAENL